jgi:ribosomal protein S18 acetylase RimI-like enzyme
MTPQSPSLAGIEAVASRIVAADSGLAIRRATPDDASFLRTLFHDANAAGLVGIGLSGAMLELVVDQQFRAQQAGYRNAYPEAAYLLIEQAGASVGRLTLSLDTPASDRTLRLVDIAVSAAARGQGIGTQVIWGLAGAARESGATRLTLSVMSTNTRALGLYQRLGFVARDVGLHIEMVKALA